jgi:small subunit ribosomal protein S21
MSDEGFYFSPFTADLTRGVRRVLNSPVQKRTLNFKEDGKRMAIVTINQGESIESALRRFKRKVMTEEIIKDAKKHAFFIPPGQKAKLKSALARKRNKKKGRMRTSAPRD